MIKLFFDIETLPSADEHKELSIKKLKNKKENIDKTDNEIYETSSLEGTFGQICCIGIIKENERGLIQKDVFKGTEKEILENFWKASVDVDRFIGHNIWAFDLPFIYKRSIINKVKPRMLMMARYRNTPIYDTLQEWELWNFGQKQSLDTLSKVLGLPTSKDEMDGSMVYKYFQDGRIDDICKYCMKDVELTRKVYYRMTFEEMPDDKPKETLF